MESNFVCPMHPEVVSKKAGKCHICGMSLVKKEQHQQSKSEETSYRPLVVVLSLIVLPIALLAFLDFQNDMFSFQKVMTNFMAGFFLVFSGFKLLDLHGFVDGYTTYDLLAKKVRSYAFVYPFLELFLGLAYLTQTNSLFVNLATFTLMTFSGLGVIKSLTSKSRIRCSCLGTVLKVPLSYVTLIEDFGMAVMALMLIYKYS